MSATSSNNINIILRKRASVMNGMSPSEKAFLERALEWDELSDEVLVYLTSLLPVDEVDVRVVGGRCWTHRDNPNACHMKMCDETKETENGNEWITIIHHDGLSRAREPYLQCETSMTHNEKRGRRAKRYFAVRHSANQFPPGERDGRSVYVVGPDAGRNWIKVKNPRLHKWEMIYVVADKCYITASALTEANNNVWDHYKASPGMWVCPLAVWKILSALLLIASGHSQICQHAARACARQQRTRGHSLVQQAAAQHGRSIHRKGGPYELVDAHRVERAVPLPVQAHRRYVSVFCVMPHRM